MSQMRGLHDDSDKKNVASAIKYFRKDEEQGAGDINKKNKIVSSLNQGDHLRFLNSFNQASSFDSPQVFQQVSS